SAKYYSLGLDIANSENNLELAAQIMINTAENKMELKDYCEAISLSMQAIDISKKLGIIYDRAVYFRHLGNIYLKIAGDKISQMSNCQFYSSNRIANLLSAKNHLLNSITLMEGINDLSELSETSRLLSQVYEQLGDQKNALTYYKKYSAFKDSVFSNDNSLKIAQIEKERELALKDKQIKIQTLEIEKKNSQIISAAVIFAALLLAVFFLPYLYFKKKAYTALLEEVAARKAAEEKIRASLKEKEILLKEVHHRVKNNMQIISSLLDIQSSMLTDSQMLGIFKDSQTRIQAMAMVHELTYKTPDFTNINIKDYFLNLIGHLQQTYLTGNKSISFGIEIDDVNLEIDRIIPIGLIVNEIISNSLKHAFPDKETGTVHFSLKNNEGKYCVISLSDDGIGMKEENNAEDQKTLGLFLITSMCEQIGSTLQNTSSDKGTEYIITFKLGQE
ncbi:MAG: sensor histidine kinase, partial [Syntrophothermus sp.]